MLTLFSNPAECTTREEVIECRGGTFTLVFRRPTYEERLTDEAYSIQFHVHGDAGAYTRQVNARLDAAVIGWDGVEHKGEPLPFSTHDLRVLLSHNLDALPQVTAILAQVFADDGAVGEPVREPAPSGEQEASPAAS